MIEQVKIIAVDKWKQWHDEYGHNFFFVNCEMTLDKQFPDNEATMIVDMAGGKQAINVFWAVPPMPGCCALSNKFAIQFSSPTEIALTPTDFEGASATFYGRDFPPKLQ